MRFFDRTRLTAPRSTTVVGIGMIIAGVIGTQFVITANNEGIPLVIATTDILAGTVITHDMVSTGRLAGTTSVDSVSVDDVVGRIASADVAAGDLINGRVMEESVESRTIVAVPLGLPLAHGIGDGSLVNLWQVDDDGVTPPTSIAQSVRVVDVSTSSLGSDEIASVLLDPMDVDRVLGALGASRLIVATAGQAP